MLLMPLGVVLLEGLNLSDAPEGDYELIALPALFTGRDGAPARAVFENPVGRLPQNRFSGKYSPRKPISNLR